LCVLFTGFSPSQHQPEGETRKGKTTYRKDVSTPERLGGLLSFFSGTKKGGKDLLKEKYFKKRR